MIGNVAVAFAFSLHTFRHAILSVTVRLTKPTKFSDFKSAKDISHVTSTIALLGVFCATSFHVGKRPGITNKPQRHLQCYLNYTVVTYQTSTSGSPLQSLFKGKYFPYNMFYWFYKK